MEGFADALVVLLFVVIGHTAHLAHVRQTISQKNNSPMLRYKRLLHEKLYPLDERTKPMQLRELARALGIPVPSLHNYVQFDTLPRIENIQKMADYFNESVSSMFSEDDDLTAAMVSAVRKLPDAEKINYVNHVKKLGASK